VSSEPLVDFLAFLVPKLCQKIQIFQEFAEYFSGISLINLFSLAMILEPGTLESCSKALKTRIIA